MKKNGAIIIISHHTRDEIEKNESFHLLVTVMMSRKRLSEEMSIAQSTDSASNSISSMYLTLVSTNRTSEHLGNRRSLL